MADVNFEALLASHNQEFVDAETYSQWLPPEGTYLVDVAKVDCGASPQDDGTTMLWWSLRCQILDEGEYYGRKFSIFASTKALGIVKGIVEALNGGNPVSGLKEANEVLMSAVGKVLDVESSESYSKKAKRNFKNISILRVVDTAPQGMETRVPG